MTITQPAGSSPATDLTWLNGLAGVTVTTMGQTTGGLGGNRKTTYTLTDRLEYREVSFDPRREEIIFTEAAPNPNMSPVDSNSILTIGTEGSPTSSLALKFSRNDGKVWKNTGSLVIPFGQIFWHSGLIVTAQPWGFTAKTGAQHEGVSVASGYISENATLEIVGTPSGQSLESNQIFFNSTGALDVDGLKMVGHGSPLASYLVSIGSSEGNPPVLNMIGAGGITYAAANRASILLTISGVKGENLVKGINIWAGGLIRSNNSILGSDVPVLEHNVTASHSSGLVEGRQSVKFTYTESDGSLIEGATSYGIEIDNGARKNYTPAPPNYGAHVVDGAIDYLTTREYRSTSGANGIGMLDEDGGVLVYVVAKPTAVYSGVNDSGGNLKDRRLSPGDIIAHTLWSYGHNATTTRQVHRADNVDVDVSVLMSIDASISEEKSVVDAYTVLDTSSKIYDWFKSYMVEFHEQETAPLVLRSGAELDFGDLDVTINPTLTAVGETDRSTFIRIKAASIDGSVRTTGTVTLSNGAVVNGSIFDSTGDSSINFIDAIVATDTWAVFLVEADRDANTNADDTGNGSENYRFLFAGETTLYIRVVKASTGGVIQLNLTVTQAGEQTVSFDPTQVALNTNADVKTILDTVKYQANQVFVDEALTAPGDGSHNQPFNTMAAALAHADTNIVNAIVLSSNVTLPSSSNGHNIKTIRSEVEVNLNGQDVTGSRFESLHLTGVCVGDFDSDKCHINNVSGIEGHHRNCGLAGAILIGDHCDFIDSHSDIPGQETPSISMAGLTGASLGIRSVSAGLLLLGCEDAGNNATIEGVGLKMTIAPSCTAGHISIRGSGTLADNSAGATIDSAAFTRADELISVLNEANANARATRLNTQPVP